MKCGEMFMTATSLKPRQVHALQLLATGTPVNQVAVMLSVSPMTVFRWKHTPAFRSRLELVTNSGLEELTKKVHATALTAVETLQETLCDMTLPVPLRVKAALGVLGAMGSVNAALSRRLQDGAADFELGTRFNGPTFRHDCTGNLIHLPKVNLGSGEAVIV